MLRECYAQLYTSGTHALSCAETPDSCGETIESIGSRVVCFCRMLCRRLVCVSSYLSFNGQRWSYLSIVTIFSMSGSRGSPPDPQTTDSFSAFHDDVGWTLTTLGSDTKSLFKGADNDLLFEVLERVRPFGQDEQMPGKAGARIPSPFFQKHLPQPIHWMRLWRRRVSHRDASPQWESCLSFPSRSCQRIFLSGSHAKEQSCSAPGPLGAECA